MIYVGNHMYILHSVWCPIWCSVFSTISRYITRYPVSDINFADRYIVNIWYLKHNHHVSDKVTVDFNMLRLLMRIKIICNIHSRLIVTNILPLACCRGRPFRKEKLNAHQFTSCMSLGFILSLSTRSRNIYFLHRHVTK